MQGKPVIAVLAVLAVLAAGLPPACPASPPERLHDTGLYAAPGTDLLQAGIMAYAPQYPLWSDGATKRRWIALPPGGVIDGALPPAWEFPAGTRLWKEFSVDGRRVETRLLERLDGGDWRFAAYAWNAAGSEAALAPAEGMRLALPGGGAYTIPSLDDCQACHGGAPVPVLGFTALQLSADRDPLAPHAEPRRPDHVDLDGLVARGLLRGLPQPLLDVPPRIPAPTPAGRAALGYLHANCGHCHGDPAIAPGVVPVGLNLWLDPADPDAAARAQAELVAGVGRYRRGDDAGRRVVPGNAAAGTLLLRMRSRDPRIQMPPVGTRIPDEQALALIARWIDNDLQYQEETAP
jgi:mono/diheme cytochrome c family protein